MLTAALVMLLCGTGLLMVIGYLNGNVMGASPRGETPMDRMVARLRRFYLACMALALVGVVMMVGVLALPSIPSIGTGAGQGALGAAIGYAVVSGAMAACHWTGLLRRGMS